MIVRKTRPDETEAVNALFSVAFETAPENGPAQEDEGGVCHWGAFSEDGKLMSALTFTSFSAYFDGNVCPIAGVGGVSTLPPYRRRGGVAACFAQALPALYADGVLLSYLYPFSTAFYRRFGYESCVTRLRCTLDLAQLKLPPSDGSFRLALHEEPLAADVRAVDRVWESRWNMEVIHGEADYDWLEKLDPLKTQEYLYVCYDAADVPLGYTAFRTVQEPDGRNLVCSRFRFLGKAGFHALLGVFKSLSSDHRFAKFSLPSDPALPYLLGEWSLGAAGFSLEPAGMVRAVNARVLLLCAAYRGSGSLRLQLRDPLIPENNGVFRIRFSEGKAVSIERTEEKPDAAMEIGAFSALLAGVCDFPGAGEWMDGLEIFEPSAPFERVFYRKRLMITQFF